MTQKHVVTTVTVFLLPLLFSRATDDGWTGKNVMPVRPDVPLMYADDAGRDIVASDSWGMGKVTLMDGNDLLIQLGNGLEGWTKKNCVVVLDAAPIFYTLKIRSDPKNAWNYAARALAWNEQGKLDNELSDLSEALRLRPEWAYGFVRRGNVQCRKKDYEKAIRDYSEAIRLDPRDADALILRGLVYAEETKAYDKAINDFSAVIRFDPKNAKAVNYRGRAYDSKNDFDKAVRDYSEAIRLNPKYADAYNNLSWLSATCPKTEYRSGKKAVEYGRKACELTEWKQSNCVGTLAAAYAESGQFGDALKWQKKALEDSEYKETYGEEARQRLHLYEQGKPYRSP
jgi:tetratricopeptide (TPR) repeat protein